jgi:hypothetical protein
MPTPIEVPIAVHLRSGPFAVGPCEKCGKYTGPFQVWNERQDRGVEGVVLVPHAICDGCVEGRKGPNAER